MFSVAVRVEPSFFWTSSAYPSDAAAISASTSMRVVTVVGVVTGAWLEEFLARCTELGSTFCKGKQSRKTEVNPYVSVRSLWQIYSRPMTPFQLVHRSRLLDLSLHHPNYEPVKPGLDPLSSFSRSEWPPQQQANGFLPFFDLHILHHPSFCLLLPWIPFVSAISSTNNILSAMRFHLSQPRKC